jgi:diguanylate cyclase (GGDEF)-like protein
MPEMDGLELTGRVRQLDETAEHYTYVILLTGKEGENVLGEAFDRGVDDFISKAAMNEQLVPRVYAADRLCNTLQRLLNENRMLTLNVASLEQRNLVDSLTGLGNPRYLQQKLLDCLRQVESRGGALCYLLIGLQEGEALRRQYGNGFWNEVLHGVARRLQQLVRPLDVLTRVDDTHFGMIALLDDLHECSPSSFKRLHEGLNLKAFKTSEGFISLKAGISLVGLDAKSLPVEPQYLFAEAARLLPESYSSGRVSAVRLPLPQ